MAENKAELSPHVTMQLRVGQSKQQSYQWKLLYHYCYVVQGNPFCVDDVSGNNTVTDIYLFRCCCCCCCGVV